MKLGLGIGALVVTAVVAVGIAAVPQEISPAAGAAVETVPTSTESATPTATPTPTPTPTAAPFDYSAYSLSSPKSRWVVVNKQRPLKPKSYVPTDLVTARVPATNPARLRASAARALEKMFAAARTSGGGEMSVQSAYRSYSTQVSVYNGWVARLGKAAADKRSARPGFSEHQTGFAVDIAARSGSCGLDACFATTKQGKWLAKNAWKYGFILRYPEYRTSTTGYTFEPWHYRWIGKEAAAEMHRTKEKTLERFFGLPKAPKYR